MEIHPISMFSCDSEIRKLEFSPHGRHILSIHRDPTINLWCCKRYQRIRRLRGHTAQVNDVAFSHFPIRMIGSVSNDSTVRIWPYKDYYRYQIFDGPDNENDIYKSIQFSPDNERIITAGDSYIKTWSVTRGQYLSTFRGHSTPMTSAMYSPDGKIVTAIGSNAQMKLFDPISKECFHTHYSRTGAITTMDFKPASNIIAYGTDLGMVSMLDIRALKILEIIDYHLISVGRVCYPNSRYYSFSTRACSMVTDTKYNKTHTFQSINSAITTSAFSIKGKYYAIGTTSRQFYLWKFGDRITRNQISQISNFIAQRYL